MRIRTAPPHTHLSGLHRCGLGPLSIPPLTPAPLPHPSTPPQYTTSYTVAFLSPEPVTMYLSSGETSQLSTDEDSLD